MIDKSAWENMKMPSLKALHSHRASSPSQLFVAGSRSAVWSRSNSDDVSLAQLQKFWSQLSSTARRDLLRIDKQALFEQVRKNFYCSRCHGLLVEGYAQIVSYGKNLQSGLLGHGNGSGARSRHGSDVNINGANSSFQDDTRDPSVHPWGGLAATRDSMLTVLDCFLDGTPLEVFHDVPIISSESWHCFRSAGSWMSEKVFENARTRERERELLYPDACGGGGRGWISQSNSAFGGNTRGHGMKDTCALHTARLSCEALVDFWSALGEETRRSLLCMKEEDFVERLMFRFDSKRFCRDCRRNVLREFKEMKELKRSRREPRCTRWFCAADTTFRYEVSDSVVHVNWQDCFSGDVSSSYHRFEWALGTSEGKADILCFEDVGLSQRIRVEGLELGGTPVCFITVRGWKHDGRCSELSAKANALNRQLCVHQRLIVGDGYVSITKGESIQKFFERAEETEEEEDDDIMDKAGNDLDSEASRPQKHARSPELARDFLLDAATVIFKEQVEKAFREGTARQNAHSIFVCLALSLLEDRVRVACKEITSLEKQNKLLEEEEDEKREEEERRERRKSKEKEKKFRRKEKLKGKEQEKEKRKTESKSANAMSNGSVSGLYVDIEKQEQATVHQGEDESPNGFDSISARHPSPDMAQARPSADGVKIKNGSGGGLDSLICAHDIEVTLSMRDGNGAFIVDHTQSTERRSQNCQVQRSQGTVSDQCRRDTKESRDSFRNPVRVSPLPVLRPFAIHDKITSLHVQAKNYGHRNGSKHVPCHSQHRLEDFQHCACGGSQKNLHVRGDQQNVTRLGSKDSLSSKNDDRVDTGIKCLSNNVGFELGYLQDRIGSSRVRVFDMPTEERKEESKQRVRDFDIFKLTRQGHYSTALAEELTGYMESDRQGVMDGQEVDGTRLHSPLDNRAASKSACVPHTWVRLGTPVSWSSSFVDCISSPWNNKGTLIRPIGRVGLLDATGASTGTTANGMWSVGQVLHQGRRPQSFSGVLNSPPPGVVDTSIPAVIGKGVCSMRSGTSKHLTSVGSDCKPPTVSALDLFSNKASDQAVNFVKQPISDVNSADSAGELFLEPERCTRVPVIFATSEHQSTEVALLPGAATGGQGLETAEVHSNEPRLVQKISFSKEILPTQCSIWPAQMPTIVPGPVGMHHQQSFVYYQEQGSWGAVRTRNSVQPLSQPHSFLVPGPSNCGLPIGGMSPISRPQTSAHGIEVGRVPSLPSGLDTLHLQDSIRLPRFCFGSGYGAEGRTTVLGDSEVLCSASGLQTTVAIQKIDEISPTMETATVVGACVSSVQKETSIGFPPQADTADFSLFHFSGPLSVAIKEMDSSPLASPWIESIAYDKDVEGVFDSGPLDEVAGGSMGMSMLAGEYSLFAAAGKGLVFF